MNIVLRAGIMFDKKVNGSLRPRDHDRASVDRSRVKYLICFVSRLRTMILFPENEQQNVGGVVYCWRWTHRELLYDHTNRN